MCLATGHDQEREVNGKTESNGGGGSNRTLTAFNGGPIFLKLYSRTLPHIAYLENYRARWTDQWNSREVEHEPWRERN